MIAHAGLRRRAADADRSAGDGWGYHWDMQTRWSFYPAGSPNVVVTTFAGTALADAPRVLRTPAARDGRARPPRWVRDELLVDDGGFFAYHPGSDGNIHNANLLGAWLVHRRCPHDTASAREQCRARRRPHARRRSGPTVRGPTARRPTSAGWTRFTPATCCRASCACASVDPGSTRRSREGRRSTSASSTTDGRARLWPRQAVPRGRALGRHRPDDARRARARRYRASRELLERVADRTIDDGHARRSRGLAAYRWGRTRGALPALVRRPRRARARRRRRGAGGLPDPQASSSLRRRRRRPGRGARLRARPGRLRRSQLERALDARAQHGVHPVELASVVGALRGVAARCRRAAARAAAISSRAERLLMLDAQRLQCLPGRAGRSPRAAGCRRCRSRDRPCARVTPGGSPW